MAALSGLLYAVAEEVASCPAGQILFRSVDKVLWIIEASLQWFLKEGVKKGPVERPLPWILFIPFLMYIKMVSTPINLILRMIGSKTRAVTATFNFIHSKRCTLLSVKAKGLEKFSHWQKVQQERRKNKRECFLFKMLGLTQLATFTGIARILSPVPPLKEEVTVNSKPELPSQDEGEGEGEDKAEDEGDYEEVRSENANHSQEAAQNEAPESDQPAEKPCDSDDENSDTSSTLSLQTAEAGSESTSQTFYSSNVSPEPLLPHAETKPEQDDTVTRPSQENLLGPEQNEAELGKCQTDNMHNDVTDHLFQKRSMEDKNYPDDLSFILGNHTIHTDATQDKTDEHFQHFVIKDSVDVPQNSVLQHSPPQSLTPPDEVHYSQQCDSDVKVKSQEGNSVNINSREEKQSTLRDGNSISRGMNTLNNINENKLSHHIEQNQETTEKNNSSIKQDILNEVRPDYVKNSPLYK